MLEHFQKRVVFVATRDMYWHASRLLDDEHAASFISMHNSDGVAYDWWFMAMHDVTQEVAVPYDSVSRRNLAVKSDRASLYRMSLPSLASIRFYEGSK